SKDVTRDGYLQKVVDVAQWSEQAGCQGILVYTDNGIADPWLVSQVIIENTQSLSPLVAVHPIYMHPYTVAKMVSTFAFLYGRRLYLNMLAGGFKHDLEQLNDSTAHDKRYDRMVEYTQIIKMLLSTADPVSFTGDYYSVDKLKMTPPLPPELQPGILVSGSSGAGLAAAKTLGATAVKYPRPARDYETAPPDDPTESGVRVGIIARETEDESWRVALERFPEDRKGQLTHQLAMKVSDSEWHKQLSALLEDASGKRNPYWLGPFENYKTFCPYLVGDYSTVAAEIGKYINVGYRTFILDIPADGQELDHINIVIKEASALVSE
ncbi:MAG: LLM class flavin-dependent oxidoreductase, partial [Bacteroidetes bacterium]|nr:LLM class flavin-dependent oxidoreductase [Bacteroidota bacterium]